MYRKYYIPGLLEPYCCFMYRKYYPVRSQLLRSITTDFQISQYSSTYIFHFLPGNCCFLVVVKPFTLFICTRYIIYHTPGTYRNITILYTRSIYTSCIRTAVYAIPWYHTTYDTRYQVFILPVIYLFIMCATDVYQPHRTAPNRTEPIGKTAP